MFLNKNLCFGISNILRRGGLLELRLKQLAIMKPDILLTASFQRGENSDRLIYLPKVIQQASCITGLGGQAVRLELRF